MHFRGGCLFQEQFQIELSQRGRGHGVWCPHKLLTPWLKGLAREMVWGIQTMLPQGCTTQHGLVGWWWGAVSSAFFWRNVTFSPGCRHSWLSSCHPSPCVAMRITQLRRHSTGINGKHSAAGGVGGRTSHKQIFCYWIISGRSGIL